MQHTTPYSSSMHERYSRLKKQQKFPSVPSTSMLERIYRAKNATYYSNVCLRPFYLCDRCHTKNGHGHMCTLLRSISPYLRSILCDKSCPTSSYSSVEGATICLNRMPSSQMSFVFNFPWSVVYESLNCGHKNPNTCMDLG